MKHEFCGIAVKSPFFLAPMANVTALPFRLLCRGLGAGLTITEQINVTQIARNAESFQANEVSQGHTTIGHMGSRTQQPKLLNEFFTIRTTKEEKPVGVQLFGVDEKDFCTAVEIVEKNFDLININCGCPAPKETSIGAGAALLKKPEQIASIIKAIKGVATKPVTAKIRLGWKKNDSLKIVGALEKAGCDAVIVHARTAEQKYSGKADWSAIKKIVESTSMEVVANGDVDSGKSGAEILEKTGCRFAMVGRSAMNNPFVFRELNEFLEKGVEWKPSDLERVNAFFDYYEACKKLEMVKFSDLKLKAIQFTKGIGFAKKNRGLLVRAKSLEEIEKVLKEFSEIIRSAANEPAD